MSAQLDLKDKILLNPQDSKAHKMLLDPQDSTALMDYFSRLNPGDEVTGKFEATLDEAGQKSIVLSIVDLTIENAGDIRLVKGPGENENEDGEEPVAVSVMKNSDGVPENEDNLPGDIMPTH